MKISTSRNLIDQKLKVNILTIFVLLIASNSIFCQSIESKLQSAIDAIYQANPESSGILVHVESPEQNISWSGASGYSDRNTKTKLEPDQPALIASSIKPYISASMLRLVEQGKLTLETAAGKHINSKTKKLFEKDGYDLTAIQIKHLLSHTSGIEDFANEAYIEFIDKNPTHRWTRDEQLALALKVGNPLGAPGQQFSYADANFLLLTEIIENITGTPFYTAMRDLLRYEEIGIKNTWFPTLENKPAGTKTLAHQYWGEKNWDSYNMDISFDLYGGGGIACPTKDNARFIQALFNNKVFEDKATLDLIFTAIKTKETENNPYYLGLSRDNHHGMDCYGHGGFWGTVMLYFPDLNSSISVYILDRDKRSLRRDVLSALSKILIEESKSAAQVSATEFELITQTIMDYIEGTGNGEPDQVRKAFHPDFNLYTVNDQDSLWIRSGDQYISRIKEGQKTSRVGRIISIDYEKDAAMAKAEILIPGWRTFTDYFLLLKYEGAWKIVHKSYTWRAIEKQKEE